MTTSTTEPWSTTDDNSTADCSLFPNSPENCLTLIYTKRVCASLSLFGSFFTLAVIFFFQKYKDFSQRLIANLSLSSLILSVSAFFTDINTTATPICVVQGAIIMYSVVAILLWIMMIMANIYKIVVYNTSLQNYEKILMFVCWGVPLINTGIPFIGKDVYGPAGAWCWFVNKWEWIFGVWYFWRIISVFVIIVLAVRIIYVLRKMAMTDRTDGSNSHTLKKDIKTLRVYPIAYIILNVVQIIDRTYQSINGSLTGQYVFPISLMHCIIGFSYGAVLCIIFVLDRRTLSLLTPKHVKKTFIQKWMKRGKILEYYDSENRAPAQMSVEENAP